MVSGKSSRFRPQTPWLLRCTGVHDASCSYFGLHFSESAFFGRPTSVFSEVSPLADARIREEGSFRSYALRINFSSYRQRESYEF